ncbi:MarR family winged helix-turn-helix transcriptional regulator [Sporosarcina sp. HYO08]|uniref:MarR family winged helix-turn-helix transcriptional regulator n=1 Tax=Sporosarcina sp. HYO08 TaxID=1759557 RepID=UPI0009EB435D|nr:MarR family transcriptional regulator [Sporosarcina sp. HYO08]
MRNHTIGSLIWLRLMRFTNQSNQLSNDFLKRFDLTTAQFDVLVQIQLYQPLTQSELAKKVTVTQGGISRMLARLEKEGYILRKQSWKTKTISLTKKAEEVLAEAMPAQLAFQTSFFEDVLTKEEEKTLYQLMTRVHKYSQKRKLPPGTAKHYLMIEQQLKPILAYMKAQIVQTYVFIEEKDFHRKKIINDDVLFRIERLVEDTVDLTKTYTKIREENEAAYDF